jgi:hypothetical protein
MYPTSKTISKTLSSCTDDDSHYALARVWGNDRGRISTDGKILTMVGNPFDPTASELLPETPCIGSFPTIPANLFDMSKRENVRPADLLNLIDDSDRRFKVKMEEWSEASTKYKAAMEEWKARGVNAKQRLKTLLAFIKDNADLDAKLKRAKSTQVKREHREVMLNIKLSEPKKNFDHKPTKGGMGSITLPNTGTRICFAAKYVRLVVKAFNDVKNGDGFDLYIDEKFKLIFKYKDVKILVMPISYPG